MNAEEPVFLKIGTEVSAKFKGAFCEATIKKVVKSVKCKVLFLNSPQNNVYQISDDDITTDNLTIGSIVKAKHPQLNNHYYNAKVLKILDGSTYTVEFDDGDIRVLKRNLICLKGQKHFQESQTLDKLPLTNPELFSTPVVSAKKHSKEKIEISDDESGSELREKKSKSDPLKYKKSKENTSENKSRELITDKKSKDDTAHSKRNIQSVGSEKGKTTKSGNKINDEKSGRKRKPTEITSEAPLNTSTTNKPNLRNNTVYDSNNDILGGDTGNNTVIKTPNKLSAMKVSLSLSSEDVSDTTDNDTLNKASKDNITLLSSTNAKNIVAGSSLTSKKRKKLMMDTSQQDENKPVEDLSTLTPKLKSTKSDMPTTNTNIEKTGAKVFSPRGKRERSQTPFDLVVGPITATNVSLVVSKKSLTENEVFTANANASSNLSASEMIENASESIINTNNDNKEVLNAPTPTPNVIEQEKRDHFVACLMKFMEDRGTPLNKLPSIGSMDVNLYKLYHIVLSMGAYKKVTYNDKWMDVCSKAGIFKQCDWPKSMITKRVQGFYKKYLLNFEEYNANSADKEFKFDKNAIICDQAETKGLKGSTISNTEKNLDNTTVPNKLETPTTPNTQKSPTFFAKELQVKPPPHHVISPCPTNQSLSQSSNMPIVNSNYSSTNIDNIGSTPSPTLLGQNSNSTITISGINNVPTSSMHLVDSSYKIPKRKKIPPLISSQTQTTTTIDRSENKKESNGVKTHDNKDVSPSRFGPPLNFTTYDKSSRRPKEDSVKTEKKSVVKSTSDESKRKSSRISGLKPGYNEIDDEHALDDNSSLSSISSTDNLTGGVSSSDFEELNQIHNTPQSLLGKEDGQRLRKDVLLSPVFSKSPMFQPHADKENNSTRSSRRLEAKKKHVKVLKETFNEIARTEDLVSNENIQDEGIDIKFGLSTSISEENKKTVNAKSEIEKAESEKMDGLNLLSKKEELMSEINDNHLSTAYIDSSSITSLSLLEHQILKKSPNQTPPLIPNLAPVLGKKKTSHDSKMNVSTTCGVFQSISIPTLTNVSSQPLIHDVPCDYVCPLDFVTPLQDKDIPTNIRIQNAKKSIDTIKKIYSKHKSRITEIEKALRHMNKMEENGATFSEIREYFESIKDLTNVSANLTSSDDSGGEN